MLTYRKFKSRLLILSGLLALSFSAFSQGRDRSGKMDTVKGLPYFIKVGEGTGGVKLGSSTIADVQRIFGKGKIRDEKSKRNGKIYTDKTVTYKAKGLKFFAISTPDSATVIYSIEIVMPGARTERDVVIGSSTQAEVILAYGDPSYRSPANISYDTQGVIFEFSNGVVDRILISQTRQ
jgi:hypothetical protein